MQLTPALAAKYASYRSRYLFGTSGVYVPTTPVPSCTSVPNAEFQQQNVPAPFLSHFGSPPSDPGTYQNADHLLLNDVIDPQSSTVTDINHGDNIIYGSFAAINFAAEYAITLDVEPLQICLNIVLAMQRLGTYQSGLNDPPSPAGSHGFMLRSDSPDDGDSNENICVWQQDPESAKNLEPSYDQYCGLLSSLRVIQLLFVDIPPVPSHAATRAALDAAIAERVETCVGFLAASFWTVLWKNRAGQPRVAGRGGAFCIQAAYPFAKIAALVLTKTPSDFFAATFPLVAIEGFDDTLVLNSLGDAIRSGFTGNIGSNVSDHIVNSLVATIKSSVIGGALDEIAKFLGGEDKVDAEIRQFLTGIADVVNWIANTAAALIQQMADWAGLAVGLAALPIAELIHRYYSIYMLQDFEAQFLMKIKEILGLLGISTPPDPHFGFQFTHTFTVAGSPSWWPPLWHWNGWSKTFDEPVSVTIPLHDLWEIPLPIGLLDPLGTIVAGVSADLKKKPDLRMLLFMSNVSADTFVENGIDPVGASTRFQNSFMMALTYRAFPLLFQGDGADANRAAFTSSMELLNSAPESFPDGRDQTFPWNQNFRWMRDPNPNQPESAMAYTGMDFMAPLMLAAGYPDDVAANRPVLINALTPPNDDEDSMGLFQLPFQGPYIGKQNIFVPEAGGTQAGTILYLGVVFNRKGGTGTVTVYYTDLTGSVKSDTFDPNLPAKMIAIPLSNNPVQAEIDSDLKGYFVIEVTT